MFGSESKRLYRDILRACKNFTWRNEKGQLWSEVLKANARHEFEQSKYERDPILIARMHITGREALNQALERLELAKSRIKDNIDKTRL